MSRTRAGCYSGEIPRKEAVVRVAACSGVCFAFLVLSAQSATAQTLERFEDQFHKDRPASSTDATRTPEPRDEHHLDTTSDESCDDITNVFICFVHQLITMPFTATFDGPHMQLSRYPYQRPDGNYLVAPSADGARSAAVSVATAYHFVDSETRGLAADVRLRTAARFGGDLDVIRYREDAPAPTSTLNFVAGYFMLTPSESYEHMLDFGFGAMTLSGRERHVGPAFTLRYLWTPATPWSLDLKGSVGAIEEHALWDLHARLGVHIGPIELFGGFRSLRGPDEVLNGPELGLAVWF
ncbi:MAG: hypothetical protein ACOYXU_07505 [Nitrospirota bacterium]